MALYIISNRLPLKVSKPENDFVYERSEGGLATGLGSLKDFEEKNWIGWPGIFVDEDQDKDQIRTGLLPENFFPVFLSEAQISDYYEGYSNTVIWPLCATIFIPTFNTNPDFGNRIRK